MQFVKHWLKREIGQSVVLVALSIAMLCGVAALVVDIGMVSVNEGQLQNAADAAALAAARDLPSAATAKSTAVTYAGLNGVAAADTLATTPYNGNANRIEVVCSRTVQYTFARIFGIKSVQVSARSVAEKSGGANGPFGYAVFSGGNNLLLGMYSSNLNILGSIHSNYSLQISGSSQSISGNAEAVNEFAAFIGKLTIGGTCQGASINVPQNSADIQVNNRLAIPAAYITMPDFSNEVMLAAQTAGTAYMINDWETKVFSGTNVNIDTPIYVSGAITISGTTFKGTGTICAKKDIGISGNVIESNASTAVCIYSSDGNINLSTSGVTIYGTLYAPHGKIGIYADNITIYGRVIANEVLISGSNIKIISDSSDLGFLSGGTISLIE